MHIYDKNPCPRYDLSNVGDGYRNVSWIAPSNFRGQIGTGQIVLFGFDKGGNPKTFKFPFYPSVKYEVKHVTNEKDLYGKYIETKWFDSPFDRRQWCSAMEDKIKIISCYPPEQEFLIQLFTNRVFIKNKETKSCELNKNFNTQPARVHYIDIEVAIENEFPEPELAKYPINLITIYDSKEERYISWALSTKIENTLTDLNVELRRFSTESELLKDYLNWHKNNFPDYITGWNTRGFDMLYIVTRLVNVFGKDVAREYSPVRRFFIKEDKKNMGKKIVTIAGISNVDLMFLYRDKFQIKPALDGGYNLNNVATVEIDDAKIHYEGSMLDFYKRDFQRFWEYNVQDVNLVVKLEQKLNLIPIARKITSFGCAPIESIYTTIAYIVSSLDIFSRTHFSKTFLSYSADSSRGNDVDQYQGAFVFPTFAGLYKQGVGTVDVNSLYPNTARSLNLSPETMIGTVKQIGVEDGNISTEKTYVINFVDGRTKTITDAELQHILQTTCILSRNNVLFIKHEIQRGIFSEWCGTFFGVRKGVKNHKEEIDDELDKLVAQYNEAINERIKELKLISANDYATQYALKILINSAYGTLGTTFSPIYDVRLAEAITCGGQYCNRSTSAFLNDYFQKHYECPKDFNITISGDTDSVTGDMDLNVIIDEDMFIA